MLLLLFWCCGWSPRERESACVRGPREKKKKLEAPKDATCPRRRSAVALFEGLSWLSRSVSTRGRKNAPDRRPRPRFPSVLAREGQPPWRSVKQALPRALSVLSLGWVRARCSPPFWLSSLPWKVDDHLGGGAGGGDRICFLSSNVLEPTFGTPQHFRVLFTSCGS